MIDTKLVSAFLDDVVAQVDAMKIVRRVEHRYPFDSIATQLLTKAISLGRAVITLLEGGYDDEAYGLSRSIVECAITLRYLTTESSEQTARTMKYLVQTKKDRQLWLYAIGLQDHYTDEEKSVFDRYAKQNDFPPDGSSAHQHWSGERNFIRLATSTRHPLDPPDVDDNYYTVARAADYYHPGCFVHCTEPGIESKIDINNPYIVAALPASNDERSGLRAEAVIFQYVKQVLRFMLHGLNTPPSKSFTCLIDYSYSDDLKRYVHVESPHDTVAN
jgi:hypothetical protein